MEQRKDGIVIRKLNEPSAQAEKDLHRLIYRLLGERTVRRQQEEKAG